MNGFQIIGVGACSIAAVSIAIAIARRRVGRGPGAFWFAAWTGAAGAIAFPQSTAHVAALLGITRGADLVFYCAILAMMIGFFWVYSRLRRIEANMTELARYLAIRDARTPDGSRVPGDDEP